MNEKKPIVFVVDDDASVRGGLSNLFRSVGLRSRCFATAQKFIRHPRPDCPSCLLLDLRLPGLSGLELQRELAVAGEKVPIIFISAYGDVRLAVDAIKAGAEEFLTKPLQEQQLLEAVDRALQRDKHARLERAQLLVLRERWNRLTPRERAVMSELAAGRSNKEIAAHLGRSEFTIKAHRSHIMEKMGASSLTHLVRMADRLAGYEQHGSALSGRDG